MAPGQGVLAAATIIGTAIGRVRVPMPNEIRLNPVIAIAAAHPTTTPGAGFARAVAVEAGPAVQRLVSLSPE